ncbi:MAG TPA: hypothetical protein VL970_12195, partial [Candidatus Acidoferrales bacterium]|nr:hypothetical protein [Candidatus Acidoferrales bacterium]
MEVVPATAGLPEADAIELAPLAVAFGLDERVAPPAAWPPDAGDVPPPLEPTLPPPPLLPLPPLPPL